MQGQTAISKVTETFANAKAEAEAAADEAAAEALKQELLDTNGKGGIYELHRAVYTKTARESRDMCECAITGDLDGVIVSLKRSDRPP